MNNESTMQDWGDDYVNGLPAKDTWCRKGERKVDKSILFCPECENMWEKYWTPRKIAWTKYGKATIPRIGKQKRICPECKEEK